MTGTHIGLEMSAIMRGEARLCERLLLRCIFCAAAAGWQLGPGCAKNSTRLDSPHGRSLLDASPPEPRLFGEIIAAALNDWAHALLVSMRVYLVAACPRGTS